MRLAFDRPPGADGFYRAMFCGSFFLRIQGWCRVVNYLVIGLGGFAGAVSRYAVALWLGERWGRSFPVGTLTVNVSGCFLIGFLMTFFLERYMVSSEWRSFLVIGFLGAYTTFSTFAYETGGLAKDGELLYAAMNVALSVTFSFFALKLGEILARAI